MNFKYFVVIETVISGLMWQAAFRISRSSTNCEPDFRTLSTRQTQFAISHSVLSLNLAAHITCIIYVVLCTQTLLSLGPLDRDILYVPGEWEGLIYDNLTLTLGICFRHQSLASCF